MGATGEVITDTGTLLPISFLLAISVIFASVSSVLTADRTKARTARRWSIVAIVAFTAGAAALLSPNLPRPWHRQAEVTGVEPLDAEAGGAFLFTASAARGRAAAVGFLVFAVTVASGTWLNLRRGWSFGRLARFILVPGVLLGLIGAGLRYSSLTVAR